MRWNSNPFYACEGCGWRGENATDSSRLRICMQCGTRLVSTRRRVFCASLADVFDNEVPAQWRADLFALIEATPNLDWLLLTKRIGNVAEMAPVSWLGGPVQHGPEPANIHGGWPAHVWIGATICNQAEADRDVPKLLRVPAAVRFLSIEPMLCAIDIAKWLDPWTCSNCGHHGAEHDTGPCMCEDCGVEAVYAPEIGSGRCPRCGKDDGTSDDVGGTCPSCESVRGWSRDYGFKFDNEKGLLHWVITGGESGANARPSNPQWFRDIRDVCAETGTAYLHKQNGEWVSVSEVAGRGDHAIFPDGRTVRRVGKKLAGRTLDGAIHHQFPETRPAA